ncbi:MAG TPA: aminotransferase class III-fold pyridoxal phosphate-dependent enzyme [Gemmataceae bacterium]|nr:aminotransferase class III-fold pyridoxal phosphate-dependent enzyme [Gemmataceae bacterium]
MTIRHPFLDTCAQLIEEQRPNLFRLYLNPSVAQTCLCLCRYVQETWYKQAAVIPDYQSFLANSCDEALSGAIKLARYCSSVEGRSLTGLVIDCDERLGAFASITISDQSRIDFIADLTVLGKRAIESGEMLSSEARFGFAVLVLSPGLETCNNRDALLSSLRQRAELLIIRVDRDALLRCRKLPSIFGELLQPDIVVFDESFVHKDVPFGAFTARKSLYDYWNTPGNSTFHSTTFQPNSISTLHFMRCLERDDPEFFATLRERLESIDSDPTLCKSLLRDLYSSFLCKTINLLGTDTLDVKAAGHYVYVKGRKIFDGVAGVACSVRGHNPDQYVEELAASSELADPHQAAAECLTKLTGLEGLLPAVSGASAVENALRIGLAAQHPRSYVLALKGGFGGKTLLALTGTANPSYKKHLGPLYENVLYIDPFRDSALEDLDAALEKYPVGVVQLELIQAVGGVRPVPEKVLHHLESKRRERGYLLFVDEVQTGMYRTGPFVLSEKMGIKPDILTVGKGTSDMMFPFAVTLYSAAVGAKLAAVQPELTHSLRQRYDYEFGYKTLLNTLQRAEKECLSARVLESGALFAKILGERLSSCKAVRAVRVFGLLIAIELKVANWLPKPFKKQVPFVYIYNLFVHPPFPVLVGFCQYEPNVLKFTPPLSITREEIERVCDAVAVVLRTPFYKLVPRALRARLAAGARK